METYAQYRKWKSFVNYENRFVVCDNHWLGEYGESLVLKYLSNSKNINAELHNPAYDIEWNGLKIDVKTSVEQPQYYNKNGTSRIWKFKTKANSIADYFLCIGLNELLDIKKAFWIPTIITKGEISMSANKSKYDEYIVDLKNM